VTALDNVFQKTAVPSLIVIDDGQAPTKHDQNRGLCPRMSRATDIPPLDSAANVASCDLPVTLTDAGGYKHWSNPKFDDLLWLVDKPMEVSEWVGDVPENAGLLLAKWTGRYENHRNVDANEVDEVGFQTAAHDPKLSKSVSYGFGETGDKPHNQPDKKVLRITKRYDRRKQYRLENWLIAMIDADEKLPKREPLRVTMVAHDAPEHIMPTFNKFFENDGGLPQAEQRLDGIRRPELGGISWRKLNQNMRDTVGLPRSKGFKPPEGVTALEFDWWETQLAVEAKKDHEAEKAEYKKKYDAMLSEARKIASTNSAFVAWELEWKAYFSSRGRKNRPTVSPPPGAECEWYGQLCELRDLFTQPGKPIVKQSRSGRLSGMKIREVELHTVKFEKQFELKCAGIRTEIKEGKYNDLKLKVDAIQHVTRLREMTSRDAGEMRGMTGEAVRKGNERRIKALTEAARSKTPLGAVIKDMEQFQKAAPDGVEPGWYIQAQLPLGQPKLYPMEAPANDTHGAMQAVVYAAMLKAASEMANRKIVRYGRKKISYGKIVELSTDTLEKLREAFSLGHIFSPEDCDVYNPSRGLSHFAARVEGQEVADREE
jgi:hypothetical protein